MIAEAEQATGQLWNPTREDYDAHPALRSSELKDFRISPKLYEWRYVSGRMSPKQQTSSMIFGSAFHAFVLEGRVEWETAKRCEAAYTSGKRKGEQCWNPGVGKAEDGNWYCGQHGKTMTLISPDNLLTEADEQDLYGMADEFDKHEASKMFGDCYRENAIKWQDRNYGLECKALLDGLRFDGGILDLKCTDEFEPEAIWRKLHRLGWAFSSAFYERGRNNLPGMTPSACEWIYVVCQRSKPYRIAVLNLSRMGAAEYARAMRLEVDDCMKELAECRRTGVYPDRDLELGMPQWIGFIAQDKGNGR